MQLSFLSQDDSCPSECTPRDQNSLRRSSATIYSPENRKKRGRFFAIFGKSNAESTSIEPSHFEMSQDDSNQFPFSQFSQDFTDRLGGLSMKASQDNFSQSCEARSTMTNDGNSFPFGSHASSTTSYVNYKLNPPSSVKAPPHSRSRFNQNQNQSREVLTMPSSSSKVNYIREISNGAEMKGNAFENDCQRIIIPASIENPFLLTAADDKNGIKKLKQKKKSISVTSIWIGPYQERPRYATDFEHIKDLGEGTFSTVFCAKKRLDGTFYAVKRIKKKISSENEGKLIVRESCALASLMNCPYMVRYFGCWIDNGHLHIQTEYCDRGSLDCFVKSLNRRTLDPLIPDNRNIDFNQNNDEASTSQLFSNFHSKYDDNDDESNQIDNNNNDRQKKFSNEIREIKNDMNFIENKPTFINDDSQNDGIFSIQKDELQIDNDKENEENKYGHNYEVNTKYNNEDDDDNEFLVEDNDNENDNDKNNDENNNMNYDNYNKDSHNNHNDENLIKSINNPQLRDSDAIFSVGGEDSRNSDTYSCFSDSNSNNNNYELKYNNKAREYDIKDCNEIEKYVNLVRNSDNDTKNLENCLSNKNDDDDDDDLFQNKNVEENGEREEEVTEEEVKLRNHNHDNNHNNDNDVEKGAIRGSEREGEKEKEGEGEGEGNTIGNKEPLNGVVNEGLAWVVLHSMASALQYMHSKGMAHLDLRPANIFITQNTQSHITKENSNSVEEKTVSDLIFEDAYVLRLGDLGHACMYNESNWIEGESRYCSLELIVSDDGQPLDLRYADMFSLGASVYELCLGRELGGIRGLEGMAFCTVSDNHPRRSTVTILIGALRIPVPVFECHDGILSDPFISTYSPSLVRFVKMLLHPTPTLRPSAQETVTLTSATLLTLRQNHSSLDSTTLNSLKVENEVVRGAARTSSQQYLPPRSSSPVFMSSATTSTTTSTSVAPGASEPYKKGPQSLLPKPAKRPFAHLFPADECPMST